MKQGHTSLYIQSSQTRDWLGTNDNRDIIGLESGTPLGNWIDGVFYPKYSNFHDTYVAWKDKATRTKIKIDNLNDAEKEFIPVYQRLYSHYIKPNELVTNAMLEQMGFPKRNSDKPSPNPPPTSHVGVKIVLPGPGEVEIHFYNLETKRKGKPKGVHGAEAKWGLFDTPPVDWDALPHSSFDTNSPLKLQFEGHERGKMLYYALRWENTTGEKGPWSEIQNIAVP
jgi:hypothetical protein